MTSPLSWTPGGDRRIMPPTPHIDRKFAPKWSILQKLSSKLDITYIFLKMSHSVPFYQLTATKKFFQKNFENFGKRIMEFSINFLGQKNDETIISDSPRKQVESFFPNGLYLICIRSSEN